MIYVLCKDTGIYWLEVYENELIYNEFKYPDLDIGIISKKLASYFFGKTNVNKALRMIKSEEYTDFVEVSGWSSGDVKVTNEQTNLKVKK